MATSEQLLSFLKNSSSYDPAGWDALFSGVGGNSLDDATLEALLKSEYRLDSPTPKDHENIFKTTGYLDYLQNTEQGIPRDYLALRGPNGSAYEMRWVPDTDTPGNYSITPEHSKNIGSYFASQEEDDMGLLGPILTLASIIPSPIQPFAMATNAVYSASQDNWTGAILSALGANAQFAGVGIGSDAMAMSTELASQGASVSEIAKAVEGFAGVNSAAAMTTAVASSVAAQVGGLYDAVTGTIKDTAGNVMGTVEEVAQGLDGSMASLPTDQVSALNGGNMPGLNGSTSIPGLDVNSGTSGSLGDYDFGSGDYSFNYDSSGLNIPNTAATSSIFNPQELMSAFPGAFPDAASAESFVNQINAQGIGNTSSSIPSWVNDIVKKLLPNGTAGELAQLAAQLYGASNAENITDNILKWTKEANPYSGDAESQWVKDLFGSSSSVLGNASSMLQDDGGMSDRLDSLYSQIGDYQNPYMSSAQAGYGAATNLATNPSSHAGYNLAETAAGNLESLYNDPMSNPIIAAVMRISGENAARKSAAMRGVNSGSFLAENQEAMMAAVGNQFSNLANPMNQSVASGSNWYQGDLKGYTDLGASAAAANAQAASSYLNMINATTAPYESVTRRADSLENVGSALGNLATNAGNLTTKHLDAYTKTLQDYYKTDFNSQAANLLTKPQVSSDGAGGVNIGGSVVNSAVNKGVDWGLSKLGSWLGI